MSASEPSKEGGIGGLDVLKEMFPDVPEQILASLYASTGYDVEKTAEKLLAIIHEATEKQRKAKEAQREAQQKMKDKSFVVPAKEYGGKCSYCGVSKTGRISYGMQANQMTVKDYQDLIDRGWRRSGTWLYVPSNKNPECCCKQYTIRLDVDKFVPNKAQTKTRKKLEKCVRSGAPLQHSSETQAGEEKKSKKNKNEETSNDTKEKQESKKKEKQTSQSPAQQPKRQKQSEKDAAKASISPKEEQLKEILEKIVTEVRVNYLTIPATSKFPIIVKPNPPKLASRGKLSTNVAMVMAGIATTEKSHEKVTPEQKAETQRKRNELAKEIAHRIQKAFPAEFGAAVFENDSFINFTFADDVAVQTTSSDQASSSTQSTTPHHHTTTSTTSSTASTSSEQTPVTKPHDWKVVMVPSMFIEEEYDLYKKYQVSVHHDNPNKHTEEGYSNFLVESPLIPQKVDGLEHGYGSFHMQYRLDDKLIAVGVVDILPSCLSSVYFFYDPDFHSLSLGVFSALHEIDWVKEVRTRVPNLHYYYMGFYIYSCPKMKYKGEYHPSDLLCLSSYQWVPLDACIPLLEKTKGYTPFVLDESKHENTPKEQALQIIARIPIQVQGEIVTLNELTSRGKEIMQPHLLTYLDRVGPEIASRMVFIVQ